MSYDDAAAFVPFPAQQEVLLREAEARIGSPAGNRLSGASNAGAVVVPPADFEMYTDEDGNDVDEMIWGEDDWAGASIVWASPQY